jgi:hypothetical protein
VSIVGFVNVLWKYWQHAAHAHVLAALIIPVITCVHTYTHLGVAIHHVASGHACNARHNFGFSVCITTFWYLDSYGRGHVPRQCHAWVTEPH